MKRNVLKDVRSRKLGIYTTVKENAPWLLDYSGPFVV
jgi:hypothetical protein